MMERHRLDNEVALREQIATLRSEYELARSTAMRLELELRRQEHELFWLRANQPYEDGE